MGVYCLPKTLQSAETLNQIIERHKEFRLLSLQLSPESFASSYEREVAFPAETWINRVCGPLSANLIAIAGNTTENAGNKDAEAEMLLKKEWLGSLTISGPFDKEAAAIVFKNMWIDPAARVMEDGIEYYFALYAMYVIPSARGAGLGAELVEYAEKCAGTLAGQEKTRIVLVVDFNNTGARRTYGKCGFEVDHHYWFDDVRPGRSGRTQATVMRVDIGSSGSPKKTTMSESVGSVTS